MREWPKNKTETVPYSAIIDPIRDVFLGYYGCIGGFPKEIPYNGYNFGEETLLSHISPKEKLTTKYMDERGEDLLEILLNITFNLGIEQGKRMERSKLQTKFDMVNMAFRILKQVAEENE